MWKRLILYFAILAFLILDYLSLSSGTAILDNLRKTGLLTFGLPIIYAGIIVISVLIGGGTLSALNLKRSIALAIVLFLSTFYFIKLADTGKVHFLEYLLITLLFFKALEIDLKTKLIYPFTMASIIMLGIIEEIVQAVFPDRTFDLDDLGIDFIASGFLLLLLYLFRIKKAKSVSERQTQ